MVDSTDRLPFPAVTVCNMNPVPRSKLLCTNFELATLDEHLSNYIQITKQNDSLDELQDELRLNTAPISKCVNTTHVVDKRSVALEEKAMEVSSEPNAIFKNKEIDEAGSKILVDSTVVLPMTTSTSFHAPDIPTISITNSTLSTSEIITTGASNSEVKVDVSETDSTYNQFWKSTLLHENPVLRGKLCYHFLTFFCEL